MTHNKHQGHTPQMFLNKFYISLILSLPIFLVVFSKYLNISISENLKFYIYLIFGSIIFFYGGFVFLKGAFFELKAKRPGMMTLISLAISVAYFYSIYALFFSGQLLFWELSSLILVMLFGHFLEMKSIHSAKSALESLSKLIPDETEVVLNTGEVKKIKVSDLKIGDIVFIRPGGRIPADGVVIEGESEVDESMVSGESLPVKKKVGLKVVAGTINSDGALKIKVEKIGEDTFLAGIMRLIKEAQESKSNMQNIADKAAFYLTIIAVISGILTFALWIYAHATLSFTVERVVSVLVVACPHALGLAVPLVVAISSALASRQGFLIRNRVAFENVRKVNVVLFDKTGTLTEGKYGVEKIMSFDDSLKENDILKIAASADSRSEHFIAKAIVAEARKRDLSLYDLESFKRVPGKGVFAVIPSVGEVYVGGEAILEFVKDNNNIKNIELLKSEKNKGNTLIYLVINNNLKAAFSLADIIKDEAKDAVLKLKKMGIKVVMITGDSEASAKKVALKLGIDDYFAGVLPEDKLSKVKHFQDKGFFVAMVGDGINDAPALMQADVGIAIGAGTNVAIESAGIILVKNNPKDIVSLIKLSRYTFRKTIENLFWATGYNVVTIPLAAGVLASKGILLQPAFAAVLMSLSTIIVAINAILMRYKKL